MLNLRLTQVITIVIKLLYLYLLNKLTFFTNASMSSSEVVAAILVMNSRVNTPCLRSSNSFEKTIRTVWRYIIINVEFCCAVGVDPEMSIADVALTKVQKACEKAKSMNRVKTPCLATITANLFQWPVVGFRCVTERACALSS